MWTQPQRPTVLVIFSEDGYRGAANYQLDMKYPPQYIPKQYRDSLIMDPSSDETRCTILSSVETPAKNKVRPMLPTSGEATGSFITSVDANDSFVLPLRTPNERTTPRRAFPLRRTLISGYWSPASCFSTSSGPTCRICLEGNANEDLISPCDCCGTLELVHRSCLEKWLSASNTKDCEVCKHRFDVLHERKPFWKWFASKDPVNGPHGFYADLICVLVLSSMCIGSVYMCALGAAAFIQMGSWKGTGLIILCVSLSTLCLLFLFVTFKFHWRQMRRWQTSNQLVHLVQWNSHMKEQKRSEVHPVRLIITQSNQSTIPEEQPHDFASGESSPQSFTTIDLQASFTNLEDSF